MTKVCHQLLRQADQRACAQRGQFAAIEARVGQSAVPIVPWRAISARAQAHFRSQTGHGSPHQVCVHGSDLLGAAGAGHA